MKLKISVWDNSGYLDFKVDIDKSFFDRFFVAGYWDNKPDKYFKINYNYIYCPVKIIVGPESENRENSRIYYICG